VCIDHKRNGQPNHEAPGEDPAPSRLNLSSQPASVRASPAVGDAVFVPACQFPIGPPPEAVGLNSASGGVATAVGPAIEGGIVATCTDEPWQHAHCGKWT
jgi:hypothetical protein